MTDNLNMFKQSNFRLVINDPDPKIKLINFLIQELNLPGITLPATETPYLNFGTNFQGNRLEFETLSVQLIINEDFSNYLFIRQWMNRIIESDVLTDEMRDIDIFLMNNNNVPIKKITFTQAWPTGMGSIPLVYTSPEVNPVVTTLTFKYQWYDLELIN